MGYERVAGKAEKQVRLFNKFHSLALIDFDLIIS